MALREPSITPLKEMPAAIYGGALDLPNGMTWSKRIEALLKVSALFFEYIVVPDGFFHCYGPVYGHLRQFVRQGSFPDDELIPSFLSNGIIVPALRTNSSMAGNWREGNEHGIPQRYLILKPEDGDKFLDLVDAHAIRITNWPDKMRPQPANGSKPCKSFSESLYEVLVTNEVYTVVSRERPDGWSQVDNADWTACERLCDELIEVLERNRENRDYRRGQVEDVLAAHLGIQLSSYDDINRLVDPDDPSRTPLAAVAWYLSTITATVYEAYQAREFGIIGGLYPDHEAPLVAMGLHGHFTTNPGRASPTNQVPQFTIGNKVSDLTPLQIAYLRNTDEFKIHIEKLKKLLGASREEWKPAADSLLAHAETVYIPKIAQTLGVPMLEASVDYTLKVVGEVADLLLRHHSHVWATVVHLTADIGGTASRPIMSHLGTYVVQKWMCGEFARVNNYILNPNPATYKG